MSAGLAENRGGGEASTRTVTNRVGLYFGLMQILFNLSWVLYVI
ncbi:hypothetical protein [Mycolicibacterium hippocampi]|nr:hypothetical protein [Mycolicibacterium hippocampi]